MNIYFNVIFRLILTYFAVIEKQGTRTNSALERL